MNENFQAEFLKKRTNVSFVGLDFYKADNFKVYKYDTAYKSLISYVNKNEEKRIFILSKWCREVKGLKYEAALKGLLELNLATHIHPFRDEEFLKPHGKYRDVLVMYDDLVKLAHFFDLNKKEMKWAMGAYNNCFSLSTYNEYLIKRKKIRAKELAKNDEYFDKISIDGVSFFCKEYISKHKYACNFLQEFVENNKNNITAGEKAAKDILDEFRIEYVFQQPCLIHGYSYIMDFYLKKYGICIEIDGEYHNTIEQLVKDRERNNNMSRSGILVVRFTNEEALDGFNIKSFIKNIINP